MMAVVIAWIEITGNIFTMWTESTALHFTAADTTCCEMHVYFADESACLITFWNEVVTIHRSQLFKILSSWHVDIFSNCFVKKQVQQSLYLTAHQTLTGW
jgi:hypothetical protein